MHIEFCNCKQKSKQVSLEKEIDRRNVRVLKYIIMFQNHKFKKKWVTV